MNSFEHSKKMRERKKKEFSVVFMRQVMTCRPLAFVEITLQPSQLSLLKIQNFHDAGNYKEE